MYDKRNNAFMIELFPAPVLQRRSEKCEGIKIELCQKARNEGKKTARSLLSILRSNHMRQKTERRAKLFVSQLWNKRRLREREEKCFGMESLAVSELNGNASMVEQRETKQPLER
jgi:hypothetical protein